MSRYTQDDHPEPEPRRLNKPDQGRRDSDIVPDFDPETDLTADGELSFDVPYEKRVYTPIELVDPDFDYRPLRALTWRAQLKSLAQIVALIAVAFGTLTVCAVSTMFNTWTDERNVRATQDSRAQQTQRAAAFPTSTPLNERIIGTCSLSNRAPTLPIMLVSMQDMRRNLLLISHSDGTPCMIEDFGINAFRAAVSPTGDRVAFLNHNPDTGIESLFIRHIGVPLFPSAYISGISPNFTDMAWSPNGQQLAITSTHTTRTDLYLVDYASRLVIPLTNDDEQEISVAWSPDRSQIAYVTRADQGSFNVFMLDRATRRITPLPLHADEILWSPSGDQLALRVGASTLILVDLPFDHDSVPRRINLFSGVQSIAAWSPEGSQIAILADDTVRLFNLADQTVSPVTLPDSVTRVLDADW